MHGNWALIFLRFRLGHGQRRFWSVYPLRKACKSFQLGYSVFQGWFWIIFLRCTHEVAVHGQWGDVAITRKDEVIAVIIILTQSGCSSSYVQYRIHKYLGYNASRMVMNSKMSIAQNMVRMNLQWPIFVEENSTRHLEAIRTVMQLFLSVSSCRDILNVQMTMCHWLEAETEW